MFARKKKNYFKRLSKNNIPTSKKEPPTTICDVFGVKSFFYHEHESNDESANDIQDQNKKIYLMALCCFYFLDI